MKFDIFEAFRTLSMTFGPSGREHGIAETITEIIAEVVPHIGDWDHHTDAMNNLI